MLCMPLTAESRATLDRRKYIGARCIALAADGPWSALDGSTIEDRETYAADAISDILTALYGPAGTWSEERGLSHSAYAVNEAAALLDRAHRSYQGDAEDYIREPEPEAA